MATIQPPRSAQELPTTLIRNMITLATSGFGLVVALAWNQVIQKTVEQYINPYLGKDGGIISLLIYAVLMTVLAVIVVMQLTMIQKKIELFEEKLAAHRKNRL